MKIPLLLLLSFISSAFAEETVEEFSFGIVPQQSASKLAKLWTPLLEKVSGETGLQIVFRTAPDINEFERQLAAGQYDFAYMNPYHYAVFSQRPGYKAFAKESGKLLNGIIVVRKDSSLENLGQLDGKTLAFPSPAAFAASVLTRAELSERDIAFLPQYVSSHDSVYRAVARGIFTAGGGVVRTFNNLDPSVREQLRILWSTDGFTPHAFAAHPKVPPSVVKRVLKSMSSLAESSPELLKALELNPLVAADDSDWNDVRAMDIDILDNLINHP